MSGRWGWFAISLSFIFLAASFIFVVWGDISDELHISNLIEHGVYADGVLLQEVKGASGAVYFMGKYEAGSMNYDFIVRDEENELSLHDTVTIKFLKQKPYEYIIEGHYRSEGFPYISAGMTLLYVFIGLSSFYNFIKIGYLEDKGKRVLCEPINYKWIWWAGSTSFTVYCKNSGNETKVYKGNCRANFREMMKDYRLKYIPLYLSRNHENVYYVHCDELKKIVKFGTYHGHTIKELQGH